MVNKITTPPTNNEVIDKVNEIIDNLGGSGSFIPYGESTSAADATEKTVTISEITELKTGQIIIVKPTTTSTVADATLKLNNFTAYPILYGAAAITTSTDSITWAANYPSWFRFDGSNWVFLGHGVDNNTTYSAMTTANGIAGTETTSRVMRADRLKPIIQGTTLTGLSTSTNSAVVATDSITIGIGKLQAQINALPAGSVVYDNSTINKNSSNELQAIGVINPQTNGTLRIWNGTEQQWNTGGVVRTWYNWEKTISSIDNWSYINRYIPSGAWQGLGFGNGYFIAATYSGGQILRSSDGVNWTQTTALTTGQWHAVEYGDNKFVIISNNNGKIAYSSDDGVTWSYSSISASNHAWRNLVWGADKFVAVKYAATDGKGAYSANGIDWVEMTMPQVDYSYVAYGGGKFVAVAKETNVAAYSDDGINWNSATMPATDYWNGVAYGNGRFVAVSYGSTQAAYSDDGVNWVGVTLPVSNNWECITFGNGYFVVVGYNRDCLYSTDGVNWTRKDIPSAQSAVNFHKVKYGLNKFITLTFNSGYLYSLGMQTTYEDKYTIDYPATTSSTLFDNIGIASTETIVSGGSSSIETDAGNIYEYNQSGNQQAGGSIGDTYPNWLCNINGVGLRIGNTGIASFISGASGSFTTNDGKTVTVTNGIITNIV